MTILIIADLLIDAIGYMFWNVNIYEPPICFLFMENFSQLFQLISIIIQCLSI